MPLIRFVVVWQQIEMDEFEADIHTDMSLINDITVL